MSVELHDGGEGSYADFISVYCLSGHVDGRWRSECQLAWGEA